MKVLLQKNVPDLGRIGEVVEVRSGYARNYLLPQGLAVQPTAANVRAIEIAKQKYLEELAKQRSELEAKARLVDGKEITIPARANPEGHLYGSVGPAQIVAALTKENVFIEPEHVHLPEAIRQLDRHEVELRFTDEVTAKIYVWIVPLGGDEGPGPDTALTGEEHQIDDPTVPDSDSTSGEEESSTDAGR